MLSSELCESFGAVSTSSTSPRSFNTAIGGTDGARTGQGEEARRAGGVLGMPLAICLVGVLGPA